MDVQSSIMPFLRQIKPESAHRITLLALKMGFGPSDPYADQKSLAVRVAGLSFRNPIGLAAGFDKNAEVIGPMLKAGFGFVETGTVTPKPQKGNTKPRVFRLPEDEAIINRLGFNNQGLSTFTERLQAHKLSTGVVGANIGHNKKSTDPIVDYIGGAERVSPFCDYLTINVSSPNTPGLRSLQNRDKLHRLIDEVLKAIDKKPKPVFVKIAPDLTKVERSDIADVAINSGIAGLIVSNTTIKRDSELKNPLKTEPGGLSGRPLLGPSTKLLSEMYTRTKGQIALIGVGGITSGSDAYDKICAGASLVQLYTGLIYHGPKLVRRIKDDLASLLKRDGFKCVADAVGSRAK